MKKFNLPVFNLKREEIFLLVSLLVIIASIPLGIFLATNTQIFNPKAGYTPTGNLYGDVELPEGDKVTAPFKLTTFNCSKEDADQGLKKQDCITPAGCPGKQVSRYYNHDEATENYQCYWSAACIPIDPGCEQVNTPGPAVPEDLQKAIYQEFKIAFDDPFFDSDNSRQYLTWAWEILSSVKNNYPYFFELLHRQYDTIHVGISDLGHRDKDYIYFRQNGPVFNDVSFFKHNIIHELAHIINGEPGTKIYRNVVKDLVDKEGYISSYAAGVQKEPICQSRDLKNHIRSEYQLEENFADTIAYFLNPNLAEIKYSNLCSPKNPENTKNPIFDDGFTKHRQFTERLLKGLDIDTGSPYPDILSCKFTRAREKLPIKSNTLRAWFAEIAVKESVPVGVLASIVMHENIDFLRNADDNHEAVKNNYYYVVSQANKDINKDTNAIGLYQISIGKTGTDDHCPFLFTSGIMQSAAAKMGKLIHDKSYYCVNNLDERIRRFCQTDRVIKERKYFIPDKEYDQNYLNLCNLKDNFAVGGEFLNWKLKNADRGPRSWDNNEHLKAAVLGFYGRCTDKSYPYNYCQEVLDDKLACNPPQPLTSPKSLSNILAGARDIYGDGSLSCNFGGISTLNCSVIDGTNTKDNICNDKYVEAPVKIEYTDSRYNISSKIKIVGSSGLCNNSTLPGGAGSDTTVRNLRYTCLNNGRSVQLRWDPSQHYDLRMDADPDNPADGWNGTCSSPAGDFCDDNVRGNSYQFGAYKQNYSWWIHGVTSDGKDTSPVRGTLICPIGGNTRELVTRCVNVPGTGWVMELSYGRGSYPYKLRMDKNPDSWDGTCNSSTGDVCRENENNPSIISVTPNTPYRIWYHGTLNPGLTPALGNLTISCPG